MNYSIAQPDWRRSILPANIFAALVFAATFYALYAFFPYASGYGAHRVHMFEFMAYVWKSPEWEHCWLVPLAIAALLIYRRKSLAALPVKGSIFGFLALLIAFFIYWLGYIADNIYIGYISMLAFTGAAVLWFLGWAWLRALSFPIAFLTFMFPLPFMDNALAFPLRILMSKLSAIFLNLIGLTSIQNGTAIVSAPDAAAGLVAGQRFSVDIADPCSGIRSLFALMMVSALYAYIVMNRLWQKWTIFLASIPLAVAGNFVRIIMLTIGTIILGPDIAIGTHEEPSTFHMVAGFVVFGVALGGMLLIGWILQRIAPPKK